MATLVVQMTGNVEQILVTDSLNYHANALGAFVVNHTVSNTVMLSSNTTVVFAVNQVAQVFEVEGNTFSLNVTAVQSGSPPWDVWQVNSVDAGDGKRGGLGIRPLMQWTWNTWYWLNQYSTYPQQVSQQGYGSIRAGLAYDRKVPGGGADPGSGKIVQVEVPTVANQPNRTVAVLPFPSLTAA